MIFQIETLNYISDSIATELPTYCPCARCLRYQFEPEIIATRLNTFTTDPNSDVIWRLGGHLCLRKEEEECNRTFFKTPNSLFHQTAKVLLSNRRNISGKYRYTLKQICTVRSAFLPYRPIETSYNMTVSWRVWPSFVDNFEKDIVMPGTPKRIHGLLSQEANRIRVAQLTVFIQNQLKKICTRDHPKLEFLRMMMPVGKINSYYIRTVYHITPWAINREPIELKGYRIIGIGTPEQQWGVFVKETICGGSSYPINEYKDDEKRAVYSAGHTPD